MATISEMGDGTYRLSIYVPQKRISFNQFVIDDDAPALIHTGSYPQYAEVREAVAQVVDPKRLAYVVVPHFEGDECGGMGRFVAEAPEAVLVCSLTGGRINLANWDYSGPVRGVQDGDVVDLGRHRLRFLETPHVHHWDSMMAYEETTSGLFSSDRFIQPDEQPPVVRENLSQAMCAWYQDVGLFGGAFPVLQCVDRIERLAPRWIHPMHGGSLSQQVASNYVQALRAQPFAFDGRLLGRRLPETFPGASQGEAQA